MIASGDQGHFIVSGFSNTIYVVVDGPNGPEIKRTSRGSPIAKMADYKDDDQIALYDNEKN